MDEIRKAFDTGAQEPNQCANSPPGYMGGTLKDYWDCYTVRCISLPKPFLVNVKASR